MPLDSAVVTASHEAITPGAATFAARQVHAVQDDVAARLALATAIYRGASGVAPRHEPFRRAAMSFMRWEVRRGLLEPLDAPAPGSPWWRAMNDRLIRDGCEAMARAGGHGGEPSSETIALWSAFIAEPTARTWYRAHNASVVAAYLEHADLAARESRAERFFLNVVLLRVLYAHALVGAPRLALGWLAPLSQPLGDPRLGMAGAFLSLSRVLPDVYPLPGQLEEYVRVEHSFGRMLDRAVIQPRLAALYDWSARELSQPGLRELIRKSVPAYAWPAAESDVWAPPRLRFYERAAGFVTQPR